MRKILTVVLLALVLLSAGCGRTRTNKPASDPVNDAPTSADAEDPSSSGTTIGNLESDVFVRSWSGDVASGLREADAATIKQILSSLEWGKSSDNRSDAWIESEGVLYAYDSQKGILTDIDDRAAKLSAADRARVNAILSQNLPGSDGT